MSQRINPRAAAAREAARQRSGEFGVQAHTPPDPAAGPAADPGNPLAWNTEQLAASEYPGSMRLDGMRLDHHEADDLTRHLVYGARWAHARGDQPDDIAEVRRWTGQMSDDQFRTLYARAIDGPEWDPEQPERFTSWYEDMHIDTNLAHTRGAGAVDDDYLPDSGTGFEGYMGGSGFEGHLYQATRHLDQREIGNRIRNDVKAAKQAGYLPADLKVSIRQARGTGSFGAVVTIPDELYELPAHPAWEQHDYQEWWSPHSTFRPRPHPFAGEVQRRVEHITNRYAYRDVNSMVDYYNSYRETHVSTTTSDPDAHRARHAAAREADREHNRLERLIREEEEALRRAADRMRREEP